MLATLALAVALAASPPPAAGTPARPVAAQAGAENSAGTDDDMAGHDHGELSVTVLVDATRFHVTGPVAAGSLVSVHNGSADPVTITATDGSFDVAVPAHALLTFPAPDRAGSFAFTSRHAPSFGGVLVVTDG